MNLHRSRIVATGSYLPAKVLKNEDLTQFPPAALTLIAEKTGVRERRHAGEGECTSDLAAHAARAALAKSQIRPEDVGCIVLATSSPDRIHPATATRVQNLIGATKAAAFDVNSVCTGGIYALAVADSFIKSGLCNNVLVIASEVYSRFLNKDDIATFPYFGDGAGAVLLQASDDDAGVMEVLLRSDGAGADVIQVPGGGSMKPFSTCLPQDTYFRMRGREVFQFAVSKGSEVTAEVCAKAGISPQTVGCFITHQANINIVAELSKRLNVPMERFFVNLQKYGNTAAASILIALDEAIASGAAKPGDHVAIAAFGGGLSWGAALCKL